MADSSPQHVVWRVGAERCELWMAAGVPELRVFLGDILVYKERAPLESLNDRAQQLRSRRSHTR